jgi:hypothetical protein
MEDKEERTADKPDPKEAPPSGGQSVKPQSAIPVPPPPPGKSPHTAQSNAENPEGHQNNGQPAPARELKKSIDSSAIWMIILTGIIAVATGLNVWIFYLESESTGKQIDKLTDKAGGIVGAMNSALSNSQTAIKNAFDLNKIAVDASAKQSGEALKRSTEATSKQLVDFENSERAILQADITWNAEAQTLSYTVKNIGKTAATAISGGAGGGGGRACDGSIGLSETGSGSIHSSPSGLVLAAGDSWPSQQFIGNLNMTELIDQVRVSRRCPYYTVGIGYQDIFGNEQRSFACVWYAGGIPMFSRCHIVDDAIPTQKKQKGKPPN